MTGTSILAMSGVSKRFSPKVSGLESLVNAFGRRPPAPVVAVDDVKLEIAEGEVVGLVGESGCGKSTLARMAAGILAPSDGDILIGGERISDLAGDARRAAELSVQMVFQDPLSALNPRRRIVDVIGEAAGIHAIVPRDKLERYVCDLMELVGLDPTARQRYPHQFSGGQLARIGIARALAVQPRVIICDESTAALDVSIQAQILNLFMALREEMGLTYLFVSHDLGVVEHISDRVAVMYLGRIVEIGRTEEIFARPRHPYTRALLENVPRVEPTKRRFKGLSGELPSVSDVPRGCSFHSRCPHATARCAVERPELSPSGAGHYSACLLDGKLSP